MAAPEGSTEVEHYADKSFGDSYRTYWAPGTIAPENTVVIRNSYESTAVFARPEPPMATIARVVITDAAGDQWETRSGKAGPARRGRRWRRWWWERRGAL